MKVTICINPECESDGLPFITAERLVKCPVCAWPIPKIVKEGKLQQGVIVAHKNLAPVDDNPSDDIIAEFVGIQNEVRLIYNMVYGFLSKNNDLLKSKDLSSKQLCDFGYLCRETAKIFDELRKECKVRMEKAGQIIGFRLTQNALTNPDAAGKVTGELATGTPSCKMQAALPKKFSPEYYQLTDQFGIPRDKAELGVFKLDWKAVTEYLTQLTEQGLTLPEGFGQKYPQFIVSYRKRN